MHIENIRTMIEELASCTKSAIENDEKCVGVFAIPDVVDMIKDLCAAEYHARITVAMQESDEGTEEPRRYYDNYRYADGRFAPKGHGTKRGYEEPYYHAEPTYRMTAEDYREWERNRDLDRYKGNRMYFSEPIMTHENVESGYDRAKRTYTETREMHKANTPEDKTTKMKSLENYMAELGTDIAALVNGMGAEEKQLMKQRLSAIMAKV